MSNATPIAPEAMQRLRKIVLIVLGVPAAVAFVFTQMQWYPATIVIRKLADADGLFSMRRAVVYNWGILLLAELVLLLPAAVIVSVLRARKGAAARAAQATDAPERP